MARRGDAKSRLKPAHKTRLGEYYVGSAETILSNETFISRWAGKVDLVLTSPPFPLNTKKRYGNLVGDQYLRWIEELAPKFERMLSSRGSLVIEMGNSWEPGRPVQSLLALKALMLLASRAEEGGLRLIQEFVCYNPSRLPSPAQWVTVERSRVVDSFTHVWWLAKVDTPWADNARVIRPYSTAMRKLLRTRRFNNGVRPSQHRIGTNGFLEPSTCSLAASLRRTLLARN